MRFGKKLVTTVLMGAVAAVVSLTAQAPTPTPRPELLHGFRITPEEVIVYVTSNGCTTKQHFQMDIAESLPLQLTVRRIQEDGCRAFSREVALRFSKAELGLQAGQPVIVTNAFDSTGVVNPGEMNQRGGK